MKVIIDTNVFVSGVFFTGPPHRILQAWRDGKIRVVLSADILAEYERVGNELAARFPEVDLFPFLSLLTETALLCHPKPLAQQICDDPDDDKFIACALSSGCRLIVSGDRPLLNVSGYRDIEVMRPRRFMEEHLEAG